MTPETDAAVKESNGQWSNVLKETCQRLERERDEARKGQMEALCDCQRLARKIDDIRDVFDQLDEDWLGETTLADAVLNIMRERDEAREELSLISEYGTEEINAAVELRQKLATALLERDEARKEAEYYKERYEQLKDQYGR